MRVNVHIIPEVLTLREEQRLRMLGCPEHPVDVVIDTDTFNEVDDQFALAYLLKNQDRLRLQAIYAAPFLNEKAETPGSGMEKSYQEILMFPPHSPVNLRHL